MSYSKLDRRPGMLGAADPATPANSTISDVLSSDAAKTAATAALVFHGYKRTRSILWALIYGLAGREIPTLAVPIAVAQGFGKRKECP